MTPSFSIPPTPIPRLFGSIRRPVSARSALLLAVLLLSPLAWATTVLHKDFSDLVHEAEVITVGTVVDIREQWDAEKNAPFTLVTFNNLDVLKGELGDSELTLHFLGGSTPHGKTMWIDGVPRFTPGERTVLFCSGNQHDFCPLVGIWQGVFRVVYDKGDETVSDHAYTPVTAVHKGLVQKRGQATTQTTQHKLAQPALPLSHFKQLISQELRSPNDH